MPFDERRNEAVAMKAEEISHQTHSSKMGSVRIDSLGKELGLTLEEIRESVEYLREMGWVLPDYRTNTPQLKLTMHGRAEIAKLKRSKVVRWMHKPGVAGAFWGAIFGVIGTLVVLVIKHLLGLQ